MHELEFDRVFDEIMGIENYSSEVEDACPCCGDINCEKWKAYLNKIMFNTVNTNYDSLNESFGITIN